MATVEVMRESQPIAKKGFSIDWLVKGSLTKIGDIFDRLTGRGWKPSSTLATSELIERMKSMMDAEVRDNGDKRKYVPHNIKLKMQWDKFSTDASGSLQKLENEFLIAAVDHINDRHYFTHAPLSIEVKPDYFTSGVKLFLSFDKLDADGHDAEFDVTLDNMKTSDLSQESVVAQKYTGELRISYDLDGKQFVRDLSLEEGKRHSVGRTKENDIAIDDPSISKAHASLLLNKQGKLIVADTGSTNGTFVRGERIAYGKALEISTGDSLLFGLVKVDLKFAPSAPVKIAPTQAYKVGDMEFTSRKEPKDGNRSSNEGGPESRSIAREAASNAGPSPTIASIPVRSDVLKPTAEPGEPLTNHIAPQPALTETKIEIGKEKQDWEV